MSLQMNALQGNPQDWDAQQESESYDRIDVQDNSTWSSVEEVDWY